MVKRLHSYLTYPYVLLPFIAGMFGLYWLITSMESSWRLVSVVTLIGIIVTGNLIAQISDLKRVYLVNDEMYFYNLLSTRPSAIALKQLRHLKRVNVGPGFLWGIYTATFIVDDGTYDVKFMKNKLIGDLHDYLLQSIE